MLHYVLGIMVRSKISVLSLQLCPELWTRKFLIGISTVAKCDKSSRQSTIHNT